MSISLSTLCIGLSFIFKYLLVSESVSSILLRKDGQSNATAVLPLSGFCMMMFLLLLNLRNALHFSSDIFSKWWSFILFDIKDDNSTSLILLFIYKKDSLLLFSSYMFLNSNSSGRG